MEKTQSTSGSFGYHGEVIIKLKKGRQIQTLPKSSNQGLSYLFNGLCKVMAGGNNIREIVPARVALYSIASSESTSSVFDRYIPATVLYPFEAIFDGQKTIIQGKIPFGNITQNKVNALALYPIVAESARDSDKALAFYTLDTEVAIDRTSLDDSFIFEWHMEFGNAELKEVSR